MLKNFRIYWHPYSLTEAHQLVLIKKNTFRVLKTPFTPKSESWGTKNWKSGKGVFMVAGPLFLKWKNQGARCKKLFENCKRVSGSKLHVSAAQLEKWPYSYKIGSVCRSFQHIQVALQARLLVNRHRGPKMCRKRPGTIWVYHNFAKYFAAEN